MGVLNVQRCKKECVHYESEKLYIDFYTEVIKENKPIDEMRTKYKRIEYVMDCYNKKKLRNIPFDPNIFIIPL